MNVFHMKRKIVQLVEFGHKSCRV